jgi:hypothetical protein
MMIIGWDIEIAVEFPAGEGDFDWLAIEPPMHLSCAACAAVVPESNIYSKVFADTQAHHLSTSYAQAMAEYLYQHHAKGNRIATWNGLGFDFPVLARACESTVYEQMLADLALEHIDLGFAMHCSHGYMVGMNTAAKALGLSGKTEGMSGALAPILWNRPDRPLTDKEAAEIAELNVLPGTPEARALCIKYVTQDAVTTAEIYNALVDRGVLVWYTRRGTLTKQPWNPYIVDGRIASVKQCLEIEPPDVGWMSNPRPRSAYLDWTTKLLG